jgi:splicing factor 3A subunit 3
VQRKQARTDGERDDSENEESDEESLEDDSDDVPYNPKNLPLGWDGKVIHKFDHTYFIFCNAFNCVFSANSLLVI